MAEWCKYRSFNLNIVAIPRMFACVRMHACVAERVGKRKMSCAYILEWQWSEERQWSKESQCHSQDILRPSGVKVRHASL